MAKSILLWSRNILVNTKILLTIRYVILEVAKIILGASKMAEVCLFIKVKAKENQREAVAQLWQKHLKSKALENKNQKAYFYCYDTQETDTICMFEYYDDAAQLEVNARAPWFQDYMSEVAPLLAESPQVQVTSPRWIKKTSIQGLP